MRILNLTAAASLAFGLTFATTLPAWAAHATEPVAKPAPIPESPTERTREGDPRDRLEAGASLGYSPLTDAQKQNMIAELERKQALYPDQMPGATPPAGMPVWHNLGPRTSKYSYNGVFIDGVDSGRIRD